MNWKHRLGVVTFMVVFANVLAFQNCQMQSISTDGRTNIDSLNKKGHIGGENNGDLITGTLFIPKKKVGSLLSQTLLTSQNSACKVHIEGYQNLANVQIETQDASGNTIGSTTSNECGQFLLARNTEVISISFKHIDTHPVSYPVNFGQFAPGEFGQISLVDKNSELLFSGLRFDGSQVRFSVIDSVTKKAVLGLTSENFSIRHNQTPLGVDDVTYSQKEGAASISAVFDSSGSMLDAATSDETFDKIQLAANAAHEFLSIKDSADEVQLTFFDRDVYVMNRSFLASHVEIVQIDENGDKQLIDLAATYSDSGFETSPITQHLLIDYYNRRSRLFDEDAEQPLHPSYQSIFGHNLEAESYIDDYGTNLWGGINEGLNQLAQRTSDRKYLVVMTDGENNRDYHSMEEVKQLAQNKGISVFSIGFGEDSELDSAELTELSLATGGTYSQVVNPEDISTIYQGLQTSFRFEYLLTLAEKLQNTDNIELSVKMGPLEAIASTE